jgi:hypothetical protein
MRTNTLMSVTHSRKHSRKPSDVDGGQQKNQCQRIARKRYRAWHKASLHENGPGRDQEYVGRLGRVNQRLVLCFLKQVEIKLRPVKNMKKRMPS